MSVDQILEALAAIIAEAGDNDLTDEQAERYEALEADLAVARRNVEIRSRQRAYETPVTDSFNVGHQVAVTKDGTELDRAYDHYLRTGVANQDIAELRDQNVGTPGDGGYTVSPQFRQRLVEVQKAFGGFAQEVDTFSTGTGADIEYPSLDDTDHEGAITDEAAAVADGDDLEFGTVTLGAFKYTSAGGGSNTPFQVSVELLQDSEFDVQGLVARALGTRIMRKQAADWINGGGTTLPLGVFNDATTADVVLDSEATLIYLNLLEAEAALDPAYWQGAKWLMSANTWVMVVKAMEDQADRPLILPQAQSGIDSQPTRNLLGYPVVIDQAVNAITQDGADGPFLGLGDWREAYTIRRVAPFTMIVDPYSRAVNGQVQYHAWERADGTIQNRSAFVAVENITT